MPLGVGFALISKTGGADTVFGGFEEQVAVNLREETGDDYGRYILQRQFALAVGGLARQLPVTTIQRAIRAPASETVRPRGFFRLSAGQARWQTPL